MVKNNYTLTAVIPVIVLATVCLAIFFNTLGNELVWDDPSFITQNRSIRDYKNIPRFFTPRYWNEIHPARGQFRPLRTVSFAVDYCLWKLNPAGYRLTNLLFHAVNVILVFYLVRFLANRGIERQAEAAFGAPVFICLPFLTALLFATHPIHTESLNLVKNRSDLLAFGFSLVSFLLFVRHIDAAGRMARLLLVIGAWFFFVPAILSKETALTLPGVLALYAVAFLSGPQRKQALTRIMPYAVIIFIYFWFMQTFISPGELLPAGVPKPGNTGQHLLTVIKTMGCYLKMLLVPFPLNGEHAFDVPTALMTPSVLFSLMALLMVLLLAAGTYRRSPIIFFSLGWIVLTLLPAANIVYLISRPIAEQRLYIPSLGFCLLLARGIQRLSRVNSGLLNPRRALLVSGLLTVLMAGLYCVMTVNRNTDWRDAITFFSRSVAVNPDSARMHNNLGQALNRVGRYEEAVKHYLIGLRLEAHNPLIHNNLGVAFFQTGRVAEAIDHYEMALRLDLDYVKAHHNLGRALSETGKKQEALGHFLTALRLNPDYAEAHNSLAAELAQDGRYEEAIDHYEIALRLEPGYTQAHNNLGLAMAAIGRTEEAVIHFQDALSLDPDYAEAHVNLGVALIATGRLEEAIRHYQTALRLDPDCAQAHNNLGLAMARKGWYEEAVSHYLWALRLDPDYARAMNNLGLALVRTGQMAEAIGYYQAALKIMPDNADFNYNLGVAYEIQKDDRKAAAFFRRSLEIDPDHEGAQQANSRYRENKALPMESLSGDPSP